MCKHKWVFQSSEYKFSRGTYNNNYYRLDTYYCEKCLEVKEIEAKSECDRYAPYWYHGKQC
jgi:hypothetical protein